MLFIQDLRQDHQNIARLLALMKNSVQLIKKGMATEHLLLLQECVDYIAAFPDAVHHPKEEILLQQLLARNESSKEVVDRLHTEHVALAKSTTNLIEVLSAIEADHIVPYHQLSLTCMEYIDYQFSHMRYEEESVFPLIEQTLTLDDWKAVIKKMPTDEDPLLHSNAKQTYVTLYSKIIDSYQHPNTEVKEQSEE